MFNFGKKVQSAVQGSKITGNASIFKDGKAVLDAIDDGIIAINRDQNVKIINPSAEKITGWSNGDATGLVFRSILKITDRDGKEIEDYKHPILRALSDFQPFASRDLFLKTQSGKNIPISLRITPIDSSNSGVVVVFRNIAKEIQENREQAEFISTASHEMRTPVASIEGYLGLALNPATATIDQRARDYLQKAHENTQHLGQLFQDLLDISKAEDGRLKNEPVVLDAVDFARNIWEGLIPKAQAKNLEYVFEPDQKKSGEKTIAPVFYVNSDRDHLHEILNNIFENAIKYTPQGLVSVNVSGDQEMVRISVKDSGIGIPAEDIPHLFQKFYRVDNSETREIGGTGLGLYLSRRLAESLGGNLTAESEYQKGSTFTVSLPRLTREQAERLKAETQKEVKVETDSNEIDFSKLEKTSNQNFNAFENPTEITPPHQAFSAPQPTPPPIFSAPQNPWPQPTPQIQPTPPVQFPPQQTQTNITPPAGMPLSQPQIPQAAENQAIAPIQFSQSQPQQSQTSNFQPKPANFPQNSSDDDFSNEIYKVLAQNQAESAKKQPEISPKVAEIQPQNEVPQPNLTISDIEKMKEEFARKMVQSRQNK